MESMGRAQSLLRDLIIQCEWVFDEDEGQEDQAEEQPTEGEEQSSGAGNPEEVVEIPSVMSV